MRALIISLKFHPGHISHLVASYKQCQELGYDTFYYVNRKFVEYLPQDSNIIVFKKGKPKNIDLAIFLFPNIHNAIEMLQLKIKYNTRIIYIFHEPLTKLSYYRNAGFGTVKILKLALANIFESFVLTIVDLVILPSKKALYFYKKNKLYHNKKVSYLPLMYDDESRKIHSQMTRKYFSYIGTIASDHSFNEFLEFSCWAIREDKLIGIDFLVATKSEFIVPLELKKSKRMVIQKGKPLSNQEINAYYASTFVVWNAYSRTTQSGVLAKSFMFGTPAIVLKENINEFTREGFEVVGIEKNTNKEEIASAFMAIHNNFLFYSKNCRNRFLDSFYYKKYNKLFSQLISET